MACHPNEPYWQQTVVGPVGTTAPAGIGWFETEQVPGVNAYVARTLPGLGLNEYVVQAGAFCVPVPPHAPPA